MTRFVLDASALIVFLQAEAGAEIVELHLEDSLLSTVNLTEVSERLLKSGFGKDYIRMHLAKLPLSLIPYDTETAYLAADIKQATRTKGLSLGDCACLALAKKLGLSVLTADRIWKTLDLEIPIQLIR